MDKKAKKTNDKAVKKVKINWSEPQLRVEAGKILRATRERMGLSRLQVCDNTNGFRVRYCSVERAENGVGISEELFCDVAGALGLIGTSIINKACRTLQA